MGESVVYELQTATYDVPMEESKGLVPFSLYVHTAEITYSLNVVVSVMGIIFNLVSVRVFLGMGGVFKDGVSLTFFVLSLSDLGVCMCSLCWSVSATCSFIERRMNEFYDPFFPPWTHKSPDDLVLYFYPVDPTAVAVYSYIMMSTFSLTTTLTTIFLAVMRCLCVSQPLRYRGAASPGKTALAFTAFFAFGLAIRVPTIVYTEIRTMFDPFVNVSRPGMWIHPARELIKDITWSGVDIPLSIAAEITLSVCVVIMARALKTSNQFRNKLASGYETVKEETSVRNLQKGDSKNLAGREAGKSQDSENTSDDNRPQKLSTKEARIIQQLVIICLMFICCNIPKLIRIVVDTAESEFTIRGRYRYMFAIAFTVQVIFEILNSSLNLFIYYSYNTKFRQECNNLFFK